MDCVLHCPRFFILVNIFQYLISIFPTKNIGKIVFISRIAEIEFVDME